MSWIARLLGKLGFVKVKNYGFGVSQDGRLIPVGRNELPPAMPLWMVSPGNELPRALPEVPTTPGRDPIVRAAARPVTESVAVDRRPSAPRPIAKLKPPPDVSLALSPPPRAPEETHAADLHDTEDEWEWRMALARAKAESEVPTPIERIKTPPVGHLGTLSIHEEDTLATDSSSKLQAGSSKAIANVADVLVRPGPSAMNPRVRAMAASATRKAAAEIAKPPPSLPISGKPLPVESPPTPVSRQTTPLASKPVPRRPALARQTPRAKLRRPITARPSSTLPGHVPSQLAPHAPITKTQVPVCRTDTFAFDDESDTVVTSQAPARLTNDRTPLPRLRPRPLDS